MQAHGIIGELFQKNFIHYDVTGLQKKIDVGEATVADGLASETRAVRHWVRAYWSDFFLV